ncbi:MAG: CAP domain-containing protein [Actinomycetota bacterium]
MRWRRNQILLLGAAVASAAVAIGIVPIASAPAHASSTDPEVPVTAPAPAQPPGPPPSVATLAAEDLSTINSERAAAGVGPVQSQAWAASEAQVQSQAMAATQTIFHDMSGFMGEGHDVLGAVYLGENVAMDSTLASAEQLLFSDPAHRAIILDARYNYVGIGAAYDGRNWVYLTENFAEIPGGAVGAAAPAATTVKPSAPKPAAVVAAPKKAAAPAPAAVAHPAAPVAPVPVAAVPLAVATPAAPVTTALAAPAVVAPSAAPAKRAAVPAKRTAAATGALSTRPVSASSHLPLWMMTIVMGLMSVTLGSAAVVQLRAGVQGRGHPGSVWQSPSLGYALASTFTRVRAVRAAQRVLEDESSGWHPSSYARSSR